MGIHWKNAKAQNKRERHKPTDHYRTPQQIIRGMSIVTTGHKADDDLVDELIEQLNDKEQTTAFPPSKEKAGTSGE